MKLLKNRYVDILLLILGNFVLAFAVSFFILPQNILSGGVAGIAVALQPILKLDVTTIINIVIVITFISGWIFLGKAFAIKTIASSIMYPVFINILGRYPMHVTMDPILASLFGGILIGVGLGFTFQTGSSTGGMDIPPLILEKYTRIKVSFWILVVDAITVLLGLMNYSLNDVLIGLVSVYAATKTIDKMMVLGGDQARQVTIISEHNDTILEHLHITMDRGSTLLKARGGFTGSDKEIIMSIIMKEQYLELEKTVLEIDPEAFLIVSNVTEVHGLGFRKP